MFRFHYGQKSVSEAADWRRRGRSSLSPRKRLRRRWWWRRRRERQQRGRQPNRGRVRQPSRGL